MTLIRIAVGTAIAVGTVGLAAPAIADDDAFGTYTFVADDGETATWTLTPCAGDAPGCARVSETGNSKRAPWSGDAHWSVGSWILFVQQADAILCEDGTSAPGSNTYSWDGVTLSGNASIIPGGACGMKAANVSIPFRLNRIGGAPAQPPAQPAAKAPTQPAAPLPTVPQAPAGPTPAPAPPLAAESSAGVGGIPDAAPGTPATPPAS